MIIIINFFGFPHIFSFGDNPHVNISSNKNLNLNSSHCERLIHPTLSVMMIIMNPTLHAYQFTPIIMNPTLHAYQFTPILIVSEGLGREQIKIGYMLEIQGMMKLNVGRRIEEDCMHSHQS